MQGADSNRAPALVVVIALLAGPALVSPSMAAPAAAPPPAWTAAGTPWDASPGALAEAEVQRFSDLWTARFLDSAWLDLHFASEGSPADGFDALTEDQKKHLVVRLVEHWQQALPDFGRGLWTGAPAQDQAAFEQLAFLLYATIFDKDAFVAGLRRPADEALGAPAAPPGEAEALKAAVEALHERNVIVPERPDLAAPALAPHVRGPRPALPPPGLLPTPEPPAALLQVLGTLSLPRLPRPEAIAPTVVDLVDVGLYRACGQLAGREAVCAPAPVPVGVPVPLDLDRDPMTGVAGAEVIVHLAPAAEPDHLPAGVSASLTVRRTDPTALPGNAPLPAAVYVGYRLAPAAMQLIAGFDGRADSLGDRQAATVVLKDVPLALAGDVRLLARVEHERPGSDVTLLVGYASLAAPALEAAGDTVISAVRFAPPPRTLGVDLRFAKEGGATVVQGRVDAPNAPAVTAVASMDAGTSHRGLVAVVDRLPSSAAFEARLAALGASEVAYEASGTIDRFFFADVHTPDTAKPAVQEVLAVEARDVPAAIRFAFAPPFGVSYQADTRVASATAFLAKYDAAGLREALSAEVLGIPTAWSIAGDDDPLSVRYAADGLIDEVTAAFYDRAKALGASATATGVSSALEVDVSDGRYRVAASPPVASLEAVLSKRGVGAPVLPGNHAGLAFVEGATSDLDGIGASFRITDVVSAEYAKLAGASRIDLRMGGGKPFAALADVAFAGGDTAYLYASLSSLPTRITATIGEQVEVSTDAHPDLFAYAEHGTAAALAAAPDPPTVYGLAVRDGAAGAARGLKLAAFLTGLPTSVRIDPRNVTFAFTDWRPWQPHLVADAALDDLLATPVSAYAAFLGLPASQSLSFAMRSGDVAGAKHTRVNLTTTASIGQFWAFATYGAYQGYVELSKVPVSMGANLTLADGQTTFDWNASSPFERVFAAFRLPLQSESFQGYVSLAQLPSRFNLRLGRDASGDGPLIQYSASGSTLDLSAFVDATLFGGDAKARLSFYLEDLGASVSTTPFDTGVQLSSSPATKVAYAEAWATYSTGASGSGRWDDPTFSWVKYPWSYTVSVSATVDRFYLYLSDMSSFRVALGVTTRVTGTYGTFALGWNSFSASFDVGGSLKIDADWPSPFGHSVITLADKRVAGSLSANVAFYTYTNHEGTWFGTAGHIICAWSLSMNMRPHPHGGYWNGVSLSGAGAEGGAWYVVPNPENLVPGLALDLIPRFTSPDGGSGPTPAFNFRC